MKLTRALVTLAPLFMILVGCGTAPTSAQAGAQGPQGPQGIPGPQGAAGPQGTQGTTGAQGLQGTQGAAGAQGLKGDTGAAGAAGPQGVPGVQGPTGAQGIQGPTGPSASQPLSGKTMCVQGDSISALFNNAWQNVATQRTGMTLGLQNVRAGKNLTQAFEVYGTTTPGSTLLVNQGVVNTPNGYTSSGTPGNTLSQDIAACSLMVVELSTNDQQFSLGALGDATNADTFFGNMRWVAETYLTAKPAMRFIFVTLQYNGFASPATSQIFAQAMVSYGSSVGLPVINMFALGGVNPITVDTLTRDGTHPSDLGFASFYGPVIAQGIQLVF
jgi:hypothetical protein